MDGEGIAAPPDVLGEGLLDFDPVLPSIIADVDLPPIGTRIGARGRGVDIPPPVAEDGRHHPAQVDGLRLQGCGARVHIVGADSGVASWTDARQEAKQAIPRGVVFGWSADAGRIARSAVRSDGNRGFPFPCLRVVLRQSDFPETEFRVIVLVVDEDRFHADDDVERQVRIGGVVRRERRDGAGRTEQVADAEIVLHHRSRVLGGQGGHEHIVAPLLHRNHSPRLKR